MAGYSGTPLWKKLGLRFDTTAQLHHAPDGWTVPDAPEGITWLPEATDGAPGATTHPPTDAPADVPALIVAFYSEPERFLAEIQGLAARIRPAGLLWIAWPRKSTGHMSAMTENLIRDAALAIGLVDVKVAAIDDAWSGLKIVWRRELR